MNEYIASTYGDHLAEVYDEWFGTAEEATVELLAELAQGGRALELGIGTGRIALPLTKKGVEVHGIDASEAMISRLRSRPGGETLKVRLGDFAEVKVDGKFSLINKVLLAFGNGSDGTVGRFAVKSSLGKLDRGRIQRLEPKNTFPYLKEPQEDEGKKVIVACDTFHLGPGFYLIFRGEKPSWMA